MKNYRYVGSQPHNSTILVGDEGKKMTQDLRLYPGEEVMLPESHAVIQALVANGLLVEILISDQKKSK